MLFIFTTDVLLPFISLTRGAWVDQTNLTPPHVIAVTVRTKPGGTVVIYMYIRGIDFAPVSSILQFSFGDCFDGMVFCVFLFY